MTTIVMMIVVADKYMTSNIEKLVDKIKENGMLSYDYVKELARRINPHWRSESWTRELRRCSVVEAVPKDQSKQPNGHNPIIAYKYKKYEKQNKQIFQSQI